MSKFFIDNALFGKNFYKMVLSRFFIVISVLAVSSVQAEYLCNITVDKFPGFSDGAVVSKTVSVLEQDKAGRKVSVVHRVLNHEFRLVEGRKIFIGGKPYKKEFYVEVALLQERMVMRASSGLNDGNERARIEISADDETVLRDMGGLVFDCAEYDFSESGS